MAYFEDLSPYCYQDRNVDALNVGWLHPDYEFPVGKTDDAFRARLSYACAQSRVPPTCGHHLCLFCGCYRGSREVFIRHGETIYAAPELIVHYVIDHDYRPPDEFIEAVLKVDLPEDWPPSHGLKKLDPPTEEEWEQALECEAQAVAGLLQKQKEMVQLAEQRAQLAAWKKKKKRKGR